MKIRLLFYVFTLSLFVFVSCRKEHNNSSEFNDSIPIIKSVSEYFNGVRRSMVTYTYDTSSRLVKRIFNEVYSNEDYFDTIIYSGSLVTIYTYNNNRKLIEQEIYTLNENQLAVLMTDTLGDIKKSMKKFNADLKIWENESNIYSYDLNGFQTLEIIANEYGGTQRFEKSYADGNLTKRTSEYLANDTMILSGFSTFRYFTDKSNTIGNFNIGISFLGKQNANLQLSITDYSWHSSDTSHVTTNFRYEFDEHNRVVKQFIMPRKEEDDDDVTYLLFTYR